MSDADSIMHRIRTAKPGARGLVVAGDGESWRVVNLYDECARDCHALGATIHINRIITMPNGSTARFFSGSHGYDRLRGLSPDWVVYVGDVDDKVRRYLDVAVKRRAEAK